MAANKQQVPEIINGVSTLDEPSAAWGWHNIGRGPTQIAGWVSVFFLLAYNVGNHHGHVETVFLIGFTALLVVGLLIQLFQPKLTQRRTLTGHNKPKGHQEPDWAYLQHTLQGPYADLTDSQLLSLNIDPKTVRK